MRIGLVVAVVVILAGHAHAERRCGTVERLAAHMYRAPLVQPERRLNAGPKTVHDSFAGTYATRTSANFAIRAQTATVTDAKATLLFNALEQAYAMYAVTFQQPTPPGTDTYLLNVYVATASDNPSIDYDGGYAWTDDQGYAYLVIGANLLNDPEYLTDVATHELYHDFQFATNLFPDALWYWEATAEWGAEQVLPTSSGAYAFIGAYALHEELPIDYFGDPFGDDPVSGVHQYGAVVLPNFLTETMDDRTLVPQTWMTPSSPDPLTSLMSLVGDTPEQRADVFGDFAAHHVLWDIAHADVITPWVDRYKQAYPNIDRFEAHITAPVPDLTTPSVLPHSHSYDLLEIGPHTTPLTFQLTAGATGSFGTPVLWRTTLVEIAGGAIVYTPVTDTIDIPASDLTAYVAVAAIAEGASLDETFSFQYRATAPAPPDDTGDDPGDDSGGGCCSSAHSSPDWAMLAVVGFGVGGRRRRRRSAS